jgi:branched-chain amino acid transport system ATP-binding protein
MPIWAQRGRYARRKKPDRLFRKCHRLERLQFPGKRWLSGLIIDMQIKEKRKGGERITVYGSIVYRGHDITQTKPSERVRKGIVLSRERHPIFPESSVLENLKIAGFLRRKQEIRDGIDAAFQLFPALVALKKKKAGFLSGGEQQMLAIGMALMVKPELLLLDEPLLGLSPMMQNSLIDAIVSLNKQHGITVILCEQFARPVFPVIDRGYIVENGMLTLMGTGEELMQNPEIKAAYFGI